MASLEDYWTWYALRLRLRDFTKTEIRALGERWSWRAEETARWLRRYGH